MSVKRFISLTCVVAGLAGGSAVAAQALTPLPGTLRAFKCSPALQPLLRGMNVTAVMRPLTGTQALRMRFELLRAPRRTGPFRVVHGANLGRWIAPTDPTLGRQPGDVWNVSHPVVGVTRAGYYRYRIGFRWLGAHNVALATLTRLSRVCALLELRPDLLVSGVPTVTPVAGQPGEDAYAVAIRNRGVTGTGPFAVQLSVAGGHPVSQTVSGLAARTGQRLQFTAPACTSGQAITVTVDPTHQVLDYDPADNSLTVVCP